MAVLCLYYYLAGKFHVSDLKKKSQNPAPQCLREPIRESCVDLSADVEVGGASHSCSVNKVSSVLFVLLTICFLSYRFLFHFFAVHGSIVDV